MSLAGNSLPERIRSTTFAMLGFTAAAGLGLVLLFSQVGSPILSLGPLPNPPAEHQAVDHGLGLTSGSGAGVFGTPVPSPRGSGVSLLPVSATALPPGTEEGGLSGVASPRSILAVGHVAGAGAAQTGSAGAGSPQAAHTPAVTPAQPPLAEPESIPVATPVSGSSSSSGLFVHSSVVIGKGEIGTLAEGSPVSSPEPEAPAEPEPPVEVPVEVPVEPVPPPEVPAEPAPEPEAPAAPVAESEAGAEAPVAAEESTPDP
jgi:hypothetical protein